MGVKKNNYLKQKKEDPNRQTERISLQQNKDQRYDKILSKDRSLPLSNIPSDQLHNTSHRNNHHLHAPITPEGKALAKFTIPKTEKILDEKIRKNNLNK